LIATKLRLRLTLRSAMSQSNASASPLSYQPPGKAIASAGDHARCREPAKRGLRRDLQFVRSHKETEESCRSRLCVRAVGVRLRLASVGTVTLTWIGAARGLEGPLNFRPRAARRDGPREDVPLGWSSLAVESAKIDLHVRRVLKNVAPPSFVPRNPPKRLTAKSKDRSFNPT
jgi:hypothetical protein